MFAIGEVRAGLVERVASDATNLRRDDLSFGSPLDRSGRCIGAGGIVVCVHMETHAAIEQYARRAVGQGGVRLNIILGARETEGIVTRIANMVVKASPPGVVAPAVRQEEQRAPRSSSSTSRFEAMAATVERLRPHSATLLGILLNVPDWGCETGRPVLKPLWAEAAMHRAYALLRLLGTRTERAARRIDDDLTIGVECALAESLAAAYRTLACGPDDGILPCSGLLREVVLNLGALFGSEGVVVSTTVERLSLPAYKRRALVLCASELTINALTHGFVRSHPRGRIEVSLGLLDGERARLGVADNGAGFRDGRPDCARSVAGGMADLLEADLVYRATPEWTTISEVVFPIPRERCVKHR